MKTSSALFIVHGMDSGSNDIGSGTPLAATLTQALRKIAGARGLDKYYANHITVTFEPGTNRMSISGFDDTRSPHNGHRLTKAQQATHDANLAKLQELRTQFLAALHPHLPLHITLGARLYMLGGKKPPANGPLQFKALPEQQLIDIINERLKPVPHIGAQPVVEAPAPIVPISTTQDIPEPVRTDHAANISAQRQPAAKKANPVRGTIIVDACALKDLAAPVSPHLSAQAGKRYLSLLEFLADKGYRIIIPEMVSIEAGSIMTGDRGDLSCFFGHDIHAQERAPLKPLLREAAEGKRKNVTILPVSGHKDSDAFCDALHQAMKGPNPFASVAKIMRSDHSQLGDRSIEAIVNGGIGKNKNLLVLTNDKDLKVRIGEKADIWSSLELVHQCATSILNEHMGIVPKITPKALTADFIEQVRNLRRNEKSHATVVPHERAIELNDHAFSDSLDALNNELNGASPPPPPRRG